MTTKLTLTIEKDVIAQAKIYARNHGFSVSEMIENYLSITTAGADNPLSDLPPKIKKLMGSVKTPKNFDYKKELTKQILKKHR